MKSVLYIFDGYTIIVLQKTAKFSVKIYIRNLKITNKTQTKYFEIAKGGGEDQKFLQIKMSNLFSNVTL